MHTRVYVRRVYMADARIARSLYDWMTFAKPARRCKMLAVAVAAGSFTKAPGHIVSHATVRSGEKQISHAGLSALLPNPTALGFRT